MPGRTPAPFWLVAALYASAGMEPYTTDTLMPAFSHTLPPCTQGVFRPPSPLVHKPRLALLRAEAVSS